MPNQSPKQNEDDLPDNSRLNHASKHDKSQNMNIPQHDAHHVILGAGMIGCYLGACFIKANQTVSMIARTGVIEALNKNYSISDYEGNAFTVKPLPLLLKEDDIQKLPKMADVLWVTVKCLSLDDAIATIRQCITDNTIIICCQNGVATHLPIQHAFPRNSVIRAMVPFNVVTEQSGHFHRGSAGHFILERNDSVNTSVQWLARQLNSIHLPVDTSFDMTAMQWAKLQLNLANSVCALADIPVKTMLENKEYRLFIAKLMTELLAVTNKKKIKLPKIANLPNTWIPNVLSLPTWLFKIVAQKMLAIDPKVRTSMWWDIQANRLTEIDFLNGKVVTSAQELGLNAKANSLVVSLIKQCEQGKKVSPLEFFERIKAINHDAN